MTNETDQKAPRPALVRVQQKQPRLAVTTASSQVEEWKLPRKIKTLGLPEDLNTCDPLSAKQEGNLYTVGFTHSHDSLKTGDLVWLVTAQDNTKYLMRTDMTVHALMGKAMQLVHLHPVPTKVML